jgi:hypothetical protein
MPYLEFTIFTYARIHHQEKSYLSRTVTLCCHCTAACNDQSEESAKRGENIAKRAQIFSQSRQQQDKDAETERRETLFIANSVPLLLFYDADFATSHRGHLILATPASPYKGEAFAIARSGSLIYLCGGGKLSAPHESCSAIACIHDKVAYQQLVSFFQYVSHSLPFDWKDCNSGHIISPCTFSKMSVFSSLAIGSIVATAVYVILKYSFSMLDLLDPLVELRFHLWDEF